jgi:hypothetical protein
MHTRENGRINMALATEIETSFTIYDGTSSKPIEGEEEDDLRGLEDITLEELEEAFAAVEDGDVTSLDPELASNETEVNIGQVFSLEELDHVEKRMAPMAFEDEIQPVDKVSDAVDWDIQSLL